jgi:uncharacterized protein
VEGDTLMKNDTSLLFTPHGVKVFGSAVVRVTPDTASIIIAVSRVEQKPEAAFARAREGAQAVNAYQRRAGANDFGSSLITLSNEFRHVSGEQRLVGYEASITFNVVLRELDKVDSLLSGLFAAGANHLTSMKFQSSRLKELRADARRRAIAAAREKAELYCQAAGVRVGTVLAIEDVNPEIISYSSHGHTYREPMAAEEEGVTGAIDPSAITVGAAVNVLYQIEA